MQTFDHLYFSSFKERLDHEILKKLGAFRNENISLFLDNSDDRLSGYSIAASDGRQWVYDSSITGATIASSALLTGDWQGSRVDFRNGRVIAPDGATDSAPTIAAAKKLFNSYLTTKSDEQLFNQVYFDSGDEQLEQEGAVEGDAYYSPSYFIKMSRTENRPFAMGGEDRTNYMITVPIFVRTESELMAIASVFRDLANTSSFVMDSTPLNEFNDLKSRPWSYLSKMTEMKNAGAKRIHIEEVTVQPLSSELVGKKLSNMCIGIARFNTFTVRTPRLD